MDAPKFALPRLYPRHPCVNKTAMGTSSRALWACCRQSLASGTACASEETYDVCKSYFGPLISRKLWEARSRMGVAKDVIDFAILRIWCVQDDFQKLRPSWRPRPVEPLHQLFDLELELIAPRHVAGKLGNFRPESHTGCAQKQKEAGLSIRIWRNSNINLPENIKSIDCFSKQRKL